MAWARARGTITEVEAARILAAKLVYGAGDGRYRGVCHYSAWANGVGPAEVVEIAAAGGAIAGPGGGDHAARARARPGRLGGGSRHGVKAGL